MALTSGILKILNKDELEGVIAHELSHIKNKDILISTMTATIATAVVLLSRWAMFFGSSEEGSTIGTVAVAIIAPIAATIIQMAISRSREYDADAGGAKVSGKPEALASALVKAVKIGGDKTDGCQSIDGPYVHRQSSVGRYDHDPFQHAPAP